MKALKNIIRKILFLVYYKFYLERRNREVTYEKLDGFQFTVLPTVFNPTEYISSEIFISFIKKLGDMTGKQVLDMGCGTGIMSVYAASKGALCLAVDSNHMAVKATVINARQNGCLDKIETIESNLFQKLSHFNRTFDIMFFNPPYFKGIPHGQFERAFKGGENYEVIREFIEGSKAYLNPDGVIYFIVSSDMDINELEQMFREQDFEFIIVEKIEKLLETFYVTKSFLIR